MGAKKYKGPRARAAAGVVAGATTNPATGQPAGEAAADKKRGC
jgi:hypothetical protein